MDETPGTWALLETVRSWLSVITVDNGYRTNLGNGISLEAVATSTKNDRLVIVATEMPITERSSQGWNGSMDIVIQLVMPASRADAQETAHKALADIVDALPTKQKGRGLPDQSTGVELTGRRILQKPPGTDLIIAQVTARAGLIERPSARS